MGCGIAITGEFNSNGSPYLPFQQNSAADDSTRGEFPIADTIYLIVFLVFGVISLVIVLFCVFFIFRTLLVKKSTLNKSSRISQVPTSYPELFLGVLSLYVCSTAKSLATIWCADCEPRW